MNSDNDQIPPFSICSRLSCWVDSADPAGGLCAYHLAEATHDHKAAA